MPNIESCFIPFKSSTKGYSLPERFTFPFHYQPHPLCVLAAEELQNYLTTQTTWQHNFGLNSCGLDSLDLDNNNKDASGKMFGVLLVENEQKEIGYLTAFSGKLCGAYKVGRFVPSVPETELLAKKLENNLNQEFNDKATPTLFTQQFEQEQQAINDLTAQLIQREDNPHLQKLQDEVAKLTKNAQKEIAEYQTLMAANRKKRKTIRQTTEQLLASQPPSETVNQESSAALFDKLAKESVHDKNQLKALKLTWQREIEESQKQLDMLLDEISQLKSERQNRSSILQDQLFQQYQMVQKTGSVKSLQKIFKSTPQQIPPSGSGDCAAPKLLQYAFRHNFKILAMAEFWWGVSPKSEIRQHKNYYPACSGKCEPILNWMLEGITLDKNPLLTNSAKNKVLEILYQDDSMAIVNKPPELLSVPGKNIQDSVQTRIKLLIPQASGPIIVHRLDMSTSGLMVIALTKRAHKALQKQFIERKVNKRYIALLEAKLPSKQQEETTGEITLPLIGDFYNRPRQLVCEETGKPAHTKWELIEHIDNKTKLYLTPTTGRTHQLRVHCAHPLGLNTPILGDDLYGNQSERLHLHAERITLNHPITKEELTFQCPAKF